MEALQADLRRPQRRALLLPVARRAGEGRAPPRQVRPGVRPRLQGPRTDARGDARPQIPEEWLRSMAQLYLSDEDKAKIEALGGWEKIMEELKKRLEEQKGRHQGGNKWIGTGGTSPLRRLRLQSGRRAHRPEGQAATPRHQGVGQARVQGPRREGRARHAQHQGRATPPAQVRARRAPPTSSISTAPSRAPRTRATSTSTCAPSGATP